MALSVKNMLGGGSKSYEYYWDKFSVEYVGVEKEPKMIDATKSDIVVENITDATITIYRASSYTFDDSTGEYVLVSPEVYGYLTTTSSSANLATGQRYYTVGSPRSKKMYYIKNYSSTYNSYFVRESNRVKIVAGTYQSDFYLPFKYECGLEPNYTYIETVGSNDYNAYPYRGIASDGFHYVNTGYVGDNEIPNCYSNFSSDIAESCYYFDTRLTTDNVTRLANGSTNVGSNYSYGMSIPNCVFDDGTIVMCSASTYADGIIYVVLPNGETINFTDSALTSGTLGMSMYFSCFTVSNNRFVFITNSSNYTTKIAILYELDRTNKTLTRISSTTFGSYSITSQGASSNFPQKVFLIDGEYHILWGAYTSKKYYICMTRVLVDGDTLICNETTVTGTSFNVTILYVSDLVKLEDGTYNANVICGTNSAANYWYYHISFTNALSDVTHSLGVATGLNSTALARSVIDTGKHIMIPHREYVNSTTGNKYYIYKVNKEYGNIEVIDITSDGEITDSARAYFSLFSEDNLVFAFSTFLLSVYPIANSNFGHHSLVDNNVCNVGTNYPTGFIYNGNGIMYCYLYPGSTRYHYIYDLSQVTSKHKLLSDKTLSGVRLGRHAINELVNGYV